MRTYRGVLGALHLLAFFARFCRVFREFFARFSRVFRAFLVVFLVVFSGALLPRFSRVFAELFFTVSA